MDLDDAEFLLEGVNSRLLPDDLVFRNGEEPRTLQQLREDVRLWVGPRAKVIRADKIRNPATQKRTVWQLLEPTHKDGSHSLVKRRAVEAGVDADKLRDAELADNPKEAILQAHIALVNEQVMKKSMRTVRAMAGGAVLRDLERELVEVRVDAATQNHYLLISVFAEPEPGFMIKCLSGFAESIRAFQAEVAVEVARQALDGHASPDSDGGPSSRPGSQGTAGGVMTHSGDLVPAPAPALPVATLAQRIVDLDFVIEGTKEAIKKDALRKRRGVLERRLAELKDDKQEKVEVVVAQPWARGLGEAPKLLKDMTPFMGGSVGVLLVYDQEQQVRLGVTEMGDPEPGEHRDGVSAAQRMLDKHAVSMMRIWQLAEPEHVAMALTGTRFNRDGYEAERDEARGWLQQWAKIGWDLQEAVEKLWQGERDVGRLKRGHSPAWVTLVLPLLQLILNLDVGEVRIVEPEPEPELAPAPAPVSFLWSTSGRPVARVPSVITTPPQSPTAARAGDRSRRATRSKDLSCRIKADIGRSGGSKGATAALFAAEETINNARGAAPMLTADDIRRNIRRPELRLAHAVARGDCEAVAAILEVEVGAAIGSSQDPLQPDWTPMHAAAQRGDVEILRALIRAGASPDAVDELTGTTPFLWACYCGHDTCVREMLLDGAPTPGSLQLNWEIPGPNLDRHLTKDDVGRTGLMLARLQRHAAVVETLLMHEASLVTEAKRERWYRMSRGEQETLEKDYGVHAPPTALSTALEA